MPSGSTRNAWLLADLHANPAAALAVDDLAPLSATRYTAYGETLALAGAGSPGGPWGYQGRLDLSADAAVPRYDFGARPYAPGLGSSPAPTRTPAPAPTR